MAARIDPFIEVLLRERGDQLYLLPDEPVTMVKDGKSSRSRWSRTGSRGGSRSSR